MAHVSKPLPDDDSGADQYFTTFETGVLNADGAKIYRRVDFSETNIEKTNKFCEKDRQDIRFTKWGLITLSSIFAASVLYYLNDAKEINRSIYDMKVESAKISSDIQNLKERPSSLDKISPKK